MITLLSSSTTQKKNKDVKLDVNMTISMKLKSQKITIKSLKMIKKATHINMEITVNMIMPKKEKSPTKILN